MRILIAEDDHKLLKSLIHIFETNNYAADGESIRVDIAITNDVVSAS